MMRPGEFLDSPEETAPPGSGGVTSSLASARLDALRRPLDTGSRSSTRSRGPGCGMTQLLVGIILFMTGLAALFAYRWSKAVAEVTRGVAALGDGRPTRPTLL